MTPVRDWIEQYMWRTGWRAVSRGDIGQLWQKDDRQIAVADNLDEDPTALIGVLKRLLP